MMKNLLSMLFLSSIIMIGTTIGIATAQLDNSSQNNTNDTTAAVINLTNASSSLEDAQNMSVIEGTMNQTG
jgi:hypothetical protein